MVRFIFYFLFHQSGFIIIQIRIEIDKNSIIIVWSTSQQYFCFPVQIHIKKNGMVVNQLNYAERI